MTQKDKTVLFLGYGEDKTTLIDVIRENGYAVRHASEKISDFSGFDAVVSFGYRHIISDKILKTARRPPVNLHIAYLPYNRGAHPNFWSFADNTPSGVTIHEIDPGVDTGPIVFQRYVNFDQSEKTFSQTYARLISEVEALFVENLESILSGSYIASPQRGRGTYHAAKELPAFLTNWDVEIAEALAKFTAEGAVRQAVERASSPAGAKVTVIRLGNKGDLRGNFFFIPPEAIAFLGAVQDIRSGITKPGYFRGNNFNHTNSQALVVLHQSEWTLYSDLGEGTQVQSETYGGPGAELILVSPGCGRAIVNSGNADLFLLELAAVPFDPTDVARRILYQPA